MNLSDETLVETVEAVKAHGSINKAAKAMGVARSTIQLRMQRATERGLDGTVAAPAAFGRKVVGVSTLYREDGSKAAQWVKERNEPTPEDIMNLVKEALAEDFPRAEPIETFVAGNEDLLSCYVLTDYHFGMLAWGEETGRGDWDLDLAEDLLVKWFQTATQTAPNSKYAFLAQLGDCLHYDSTESVTPAHHNILDADSRPQKMIRVVIRALRRVIAMLLEKHEHVYFLNADANHDPHSSSWMREFWSVFYENEQRITVETSPDTYYCHEFGKTSLFFHHGHKRNLSNVDHVFASKFREVFGRTKFSYAHLGHLHQYAAKESNLMILEQHPTLAPEDAYAAKGGWSHIRNAKVITYHREFGEIGRLIIPPEMVK